MLKRKGSVLAITVGFSLVFTMLGLASIYMSTLQSETQEKQILSQQAFWLAEAGIQRAFYNVPSNLGPFQENLGNGSYIVPPVQQISPVRWHIKSTGTVNNISRIIEADVGANVIDAITTTGSLFAPGGGGLNDQIDPDGSYKEHYSFTFQEIFRMDQATMQSMMTSNPDSGNNPDTTDGVIWVKNGNVKITGNWNHSGIMIVNGDLEMEGGHFAGVIWVNGKCTKINGNDVIDGAIFVNDPTSGQTTINGNSAITFSTTSIDNAFGYISTSSPQTIHNIIFWEEVT